jgi:hypothetical protein
MDGAAVSAGWDGSADVGGGGLGEVLGLDPQAAIRSTNGMTGTRRRCREGMPPSLGQT